ncbi:MAG: sugar-transfer associated ATP-grasp domain-containing protein [Myxococcota bacterium]
MADRWSRLRGYLQLYRLRESEGHLPAATQLLESLVLLVRFRIGPGFYQLAGLWRRSVSWRDKTAHLTKRAYEKRVDQLNPREYRKLSQNKVAEKAILQLHGLPTPRYLGHLDARTGMAFDGAPLRSAAQLAALLERLDDARVCFKPTEGFAGRGFRAVEVLRGPAGPSLRPLGEEAALSAEDFCREVGLELGGSFLVESYLVQHPDYAAFNPSSVNTLRLWTLQPLGGDPKVVLGYLRIGRQGSLVDNQCSGGIVAPVDLDTGLLRAALDGLPERREYPSHPDHGAAIEGQKACRLDEAVSLARHALGAFPKLRFAGFDIAMTGEGPAVIEMNVCPDLVGAAFADVPAARALREL